jgi:uncharacterized protein YprB with RNaseH-like and TPR domain
MSALATKLERLRAQAGLVDRSVRTAHEPLAESSFVRDVHATPLASPPRATPIPESIRRLLGIRTRVLAPMPPRAFDRELPGDEIAPGLRHRELLFDWGAAPDSLDASFAKDFGLIDRRDVLAFDTETTGLAGGTGTRAFMIGVADWIETPRPAFVGAAQAATLSPGINARFPVESALVGAAQAAKLSPGINARFPAECALVGAAQAAKLSPGINPRSPAESALVGAAQAAKLLPGTDPGCPRESIAACAAPTRNIASTLRVRQLFLTELRGEAAMLDVFAGWVAPSTVLVSYNGRCFDAPLLETRYRLARRPPPLAGLRHLDLLFPTRRRYKGRWENCRLATIERQVLGVVREDDLPGSEAPRAWLDWLRGGGAGDFRRVLDHNDQDVRSLVRLLLHLAAHGSSP